ncbi:GNAT family N-acetyltransferase [Luteimonas sp. 100069]|uniref:GNAT family N-acetyltransferase n=1 Tax=Luteimonas sp. 100069 TaxID=2006109 RepID=UPI000F4F9585|nr:GNAT family N-acetyltransferase [Luteimonas sp. 100069]RPD88243.1 N-acetyltransferase [Luteimonas sp. 100069]
MRIETDRLLLRPHAIEDFDALRALMRDPEVMWHITRVVPSDEDIWNRLLRYIGHWTALGFGIFAVIERKTGRNIGGVGFADFRRGLGDAFSASPEAAWVFAKEAHGRGIALEATQAMHAWFDAQPFGGRSVCIINPDNAPSRKLAGKLGYVETGPTQYHGETTLTFERLRPV